MMIAPYAQLLHMKVKNHLEYVYQGCVIRIGWFLRFIACVMGWVYSLAVTQDYCTFPKSGQAPAVIMQ